LFLPNHYQTMRGSRMMDFTEQLTFTLRRIHSWARLMLQGYSRCWTVTNWALRRASLQSKIQDFLQASPFRLHLSNKTSTRQPVTAHFVATGHVPRSRVLQESANKPWYPSSALPLSSLFDRTRRKISRRRKWGLRFRSLASVHEWICPAFTDWCSSSTPGQDKIRWRQFLEVAYNFPPSGVTVHNPHFVHTYRAYFDTLDSWRQVSHSDMVGSWTQSDLQPGDNCLVWKPIPWSQSRDTWVFRVWKASLTTLMTQVLHRLR